MEWDEMDWQARADTGRALGGQHLRLVEYVKEKIDDELYATCPECGGTAIRQYADPANRGMTMRYKLCLAAGCEHRFDVELAP